MACHALVAWLFLNSLAAGGGSLAGAGLAGSSSAGRRVSIETRETALAPWPSGAMEALLLIRTHTHTHTHTYTHESMPGQPD